MTPTGRRFPPPWSVEDISAAFVVKDGSGQSSPMFITRRNRATRSLQATGPVDETLRKHSAFGF